MVSEDTLSLPLWGRGSCWHQGGRGWGCHEEPDTYEVPSHHRGQSSTKGEERSRKGSAGIGLQRGEMTAQPETVTVAMESISLDPEGNKLVVPIMHGLLRWPLVPGPL